MPKFQFTELHTILILDTRGDLHRKQILNIKEQYKSKKQNKNKYLLSLQQVSGHIHIRHFLEIFHRLSSSSNQASGNLTPLKQRKRSQSKRRILTRPWRHSLLIFEVNGRNLQRHVRATRNGKKPEKTGEKRDWQERGLCSTMENILQNKIKPQSAEIKDAKV